MKRNASKITDFLALTVFAVFAVCVLLVLLYGADCYADLVRRGEETFRSRTAVGYLTTRVRQAESVSVTDLEGCDALVFHENTDGLSFVTYVYCYEGFLRELYCAPGASLPPSAGEKIMEAEKLSLLAADGLLTANIDGTDVILQLRGKEGSGS